MKPRCVRDGLDVVLRSQIVVRPRNCRMLSYTETRDCLRKRKPDIEIGIVVAAPVSRPPAGIHAELHEIGEPSDLARTRGFAARQGPKLIEIDCSRALSGEV